MSERTTRQKERFRFFVSMALIAIIFHGFWEMAQMPGYSDLAGKSWRETIPRCLPAVFGDVVITFWIYGIGALATGNVDWGLEPSRWNLYLTLVLLGGMHAAWIEQIALMSGRWSYTEAMPILPRIGVGLWPLLQLSLLIPLTVALSRRYASRGVPR